MPLSDFLQVTYQFTSTRVQDMRQVAAGYDVSNTTGDNRVTGLGGMLVGALFKEAVSGAKKLGNTATKYFREGPRQEAALRKVDAWLQEQPPSAARDFLDRVEPADLSSVAGALRDLRADFDGSEFKNSVRSTFLTLKREDDDVGTVQEAADLLCSAVFRALAESDSALREKAQRLLFETSVENVGSAVGSVVRHEAADLRTALEHGLTSVYAQLNDIRDVAVQLFDTFDAASGHLPLAVRRRALRQKSTAELASLVVPNSWVALNGAHGCGKTQLALSLADVLGVNPTWLSLRDLSSDDAAIAIRRVSSSRSHTLATGALVILDDLPRVEPGGRLETQLQLLAMTVSGSGARLVSLSNFTLPASTAEFVTSARPCPLFTATEISEYMESLGAPEVVRGEKQCQFYEARTQGNALLVRTLVQFLADRSWVVGDEDLLDLVGAGHARGIGQQVLRRIVATVDDREGRELLYRLALWDGSFDDDIVHVASKVEPVVASPGECMASLRDIWVEAIGAMSYRVTAAVRAIDPSPLSEAVKRSTHEKFGDYLVRDEVLSVTRAFLAVAHYFACRRFGKAGTLMLSVLSKLFIQEQKTKDFGFLSIQLPSECDVALQVPVVTLQVALRILSGKESETSETTLRILLDRVEERSGWAVVSATAMVVPRLALLRPGLAADLVLEAMKWSHTAKLPDGSRFNLPNGYRIEDALLNAAGLVKTLPEVDALLATLRRLRDAGIEMKFTGEVADGAVFALSDHLSVLERKKPETERDWPAVVDVLARVQDGARTLKWRSLELRATRADVLIRAEHLREPALARDRARAMLLDSDDSEARFFLNEAVARTFMLEGRWDQAVQSLEQVLENIPRGEERTAIYFLVDLGIDCKDAVLASDHFRRAEEQLALLEDPEPIERVRILGELALANDNAGDWAGAYDAAEGAMRILFDSTDEEGSSWKAVSLFLWQVGAYLSANSRGKVSEMNLQRPRPGIMFGDRSVADLYSEARRNMACWLHADYADINERWAQASEWRRKALDGIATFEGGMALVVGTSAIAQLVQEEDFDAAIAASAVKTERSEQHIFFFVVPSFALHACRVRSDSVWRNCASALGHANQRLTDGTGVLLGAAHVFDLAAASGTSAVELLRLATNQGPGTWMAAVLAASVRPEISLQQAFAYQLSALMPMWTWFEQQSSVMARLLLPFVEDFWTQAVERSGFQFRSPRHVRDELGRTRTVRPHDRVRHVLRTVADGLGGSLPDNVRTWLWDPK